MITFGSLGLLSGSHIRFAIKPSCGLVATMKRYAATITSITTVKRFISHFLL
jgi:hypothetical protein